MNINSQNIAFNYEKKTYLINDDVLKKTILPPDCVDLIVTSPPYNVGIDYNSSNDNNAYGKYLEFSRQWIENCFYWAKDESRFLLNIPLDKNKNGVQSVGADITRIAKEAGWLYRSTIVWNEGNISRRTAWGSWISASAPCVIAPVELIIIFYKKNWKKTNGSKISDISKDEFISWTNGLWTFNGESKKRIGHPAPFPRELPKRCIKLFSYVDDIVLDPFCGSGTTMIEAFLNHREFIGIDIDQNYCQLAKKRFLDIVNKEKELL
ncbi:site-specific DNA-methyltransferase [Helicobacter sp. 13S00477-4]|uniref:DNA-methyltransferase n=1 Tax=Helicobacter sp. 13S00477-4 TaxID=1905759 RepID=UPI000BCDCA43|nr:site-specific DNA-methyltransferase [Helicobacter sp. 13S00477-4]PAF52395.1 site-specific DNA-methyltransferase [Helicobacter sp. 13S00477-4]